MILSWQRLAMATVLLNGARYRTLLEESSPKSDKGDRDDCFSQIYRLFGRLICNLRS